MIQIESFRFVNTRYEQQETLCWLRAIISCSAHMSRLLSGKKIPGAVVSFGGVAVVTTSNANATFGFLVCLAFSLAIQSSENLHTSFTCGETCTCIFGWWKISLDCQSGILTVSASYVHCKLERVHFELMFSAGLKEFALPVLCQPFLLRFNPRANSCLATHGGRK